MGASHFSGPVVSAAGFVTGTSDMASPAILSGSGVPTMAAAKGTLYLNTAGSGVADRAFINTNGSTGWAAVTTAS
jgi:hypothetical protein